MLEEEHEGSRTKKRCIFSEELGFAELRRLVGWWLGRGEMGYWRICFGHLLVRGSRRECCCSSGILSSSEGRPLASEDGGYWPGRRMYSWAHAVDAN